LGWIKKRLLFTRIQELPNQSAARMVDIKVARFGQKKNQSINIEAGSEPVKTVS
jgi:hypothetical protein